MTSLLWLRRDLRRADHPALIAASDGSPPGGVVAAFVIEPGLWASAGPVRRAWLAASVRAAREEYADRLVVRLGDPREVIPALVRETEARSVHVTRETTPVGARRDAAVARELGQTGASWVETGTPYAVGPGMVRSGSGDPYKVFTAFAKAWRQHGWPDPAPDAGNLDLVDVGSDRQAEKLLGEALVADDLPALPEAGERAALTRWRAFLADGLAGYDETRDRPDRDATSRLSPYLKVGSVHPRTLLADLADLADESGSGVDRFVTELAWREFYADVLHHHPRSAWSDLRPQLSSLSYDEPEDAVEAWRRGRTGYPLVDAGMRQLLSTGWMHNRVRMVTASFLTKDLHVWWPVGARWFLQRLIDGDVASNSHGWQWVAGTGTDASPYFRVFNPVSQGERFDPDGDYVRRWVPELAHLPRATIHRPWDHPEGYAHGYPLRIVDHAERRREALRRYEAARPRHL